MRNAQFIGVASLALLFSAACGGDPIADGDVIASCGRIEERSTTNGWIRAVESDLDSSGMSSQSVLATPDGTFELTQSTETHRSLARICRSSAMARAQAAAAACLARVAREGEPPEQPEGDETDHRIRLANAASRSNYDDTRACAGAVREMLRVGDSVAQLPDGARRVARCFTGGPESGPQTECSSELVLSPDGRFWCEAAAGRLSPARAQRALAELQQRTHELEGDSNGWQLDDPVQYREERAGDEDDMREVLGSLWTRCGMRGAGS